MAADPDARKITINYTGGSVYMTIGALKSLLGSNYDTLVSQPEDVTVDVDGHPRVRVIGGPSIQVAAHTYTYKQWPTSESGFADGGSVVLVSWQGSDGEWTARVNGSFADFGTFLQDNATSPSFFKSQRGTKYGPF
jgi:hypothetical protein|tara:strand:- start:3846 stop:4253 length:408 start_codon:yes stop_codon:yes gene_type:complete